MPDSFVDPRTSVRRSFAARFSALAALGIATSWLVACSKPTPEPSEPPRPARTETVAATSPGDASSPSSGPSCQTDADCAKASMYCQDLPCACVPYAKAAGVPKCTSPGSVQCLVDPCQRKDVHCQAGACVITAAGAAQ